MWPMARPPKYSPEVRERAVRMVLEHTGDHPSQWAAIRSVGEKLGCSVEALRRWVRQACSGGVADRPELLRLVIRKKRPRLNFGQDSACGERQESLTRSVAAVRSRV